MDYGRQNSFRNSQQLFWIHMLLCAECFRQQIDMIMNNDNEMNLIGNIVDHQEGYCWLETIPILPIENSLVAKLLIRSLTPLSATILLHLQLFRFLFNLLTISNSKQSHKPTHVLRFCLFFLHITNTRYLSLKLWLSQKKMQNLYKSA